MQNATEDRPIQRRQFCAGEGIDERVIRNHPHLQIPFQVNIKNLTATEVHDLLGRITLTLGAEYFREESLFLDVLADQLKAARAPRSFLDGPYVGVIATPTDVLRLATFEALMPGGTVYAYDQIQVLLDGVQAMNDVPAVHDEGTQSTIRPKQS